MNLLKNIFILLSLCLPLSYSYAQQLNFNISTNNKYLSGYYPNETVIGYGTISHIGQHKGFFISTNRKNTSMMGTNLIITGRNNINNKINIKIKGHNWLPDKDNNFILLTDNNEAYFQIVLDGDQYIKSDKYNISLDGAYIINTY